MHTTSTYPSADSELNLAVIETLRNHFNLPVGYSGHEVSAMPSVMAVVGFDACCVERHITVDRAMWGSDHAASLEPSGLNRVIRGGNNLADGAVSDEGKAAALANTAKLGFANEGAA